MRVLVVAAHPDDELLGPGGTLARHVHEGDEVHVRILSDGVSSRYPTHMQSVLTGAASQVGTHLRFASVTVDDFPDQRLDQLPLLEVTQRIESAVDELRPEFVYTHFHGDVNADHGIAAQATWTACRPYVAPQLRQFAVFETPSSTEWGWPVAGSQFLPNHFVDIGDYLGLKLDAMALYESELRPYPHPRSIRALTERAAHWGSVVGREAVEAFQVMREVR